MATLRRILAATDFSDHSRGALDHAAYLAMSLGAELYLLHVFEPRFYHQDVLRWIGTEAQEWIKSIREDERKRLAGLEKEIGASGVKVRAVFKEGIPFREILKAAGDLSADLIVLGIQGRTGLDRFMMGSVAERVARKAPCPVLIVRPKTGAGAKRKKRP